MTTAQTQTHRSPMTHATLEARANQRAHDQHIHIIAVPGRPGLYQTSSKSEPGKKYSLAAGPDSIVGCSCEGFTRRQSCKHAEALRNRLAREQIRTERQLRHTARYHLTMIGERYLATEGWRPAEEAPANVVRFERGVRRYEPACDLWND